MLEAKVITNAVKRDPVEFYELVWRPEAFPLWASGLSDASLRPDGDAWTARGPEGPVRIRFSPRNGFGVMDHWVDLGDGRVIYVPLRIVANGLGSEVMLTLFRQPDTDAAAFAADEAWVTRDLGRLKALAERG